MNIVRLFEATPMPRVIALGSFDGVHYAHRAVLREACLRAKLLHASSAAFTFTSDPSFLLGRPQKLLQTPEERQEHLTQIGLDETVYADFDAAMCRRSPENFYRLLKDTLTPVALVCGYNYTFGTKGAGDVDLLKTWCGKDGIPCYVVEPVKLGNFTVSSTLIREKIQEGAVDTANRLLGYPYGFTSPVVRGNGLGHAFGYPTANQPLPKDKVIPAYGVYLSLVNIDGTDYHAVTNVGVKPTVTAENRPVAESFLLDYRGDLYGKTLRLSFLQYLRPEWRFDSVEALTKQIKADVDSAKRYFHE